MRLFRILTKYCGFGIIFTTKTLHSRNERRRAALCVPTSQFLNNKNNNHNISEHADKSEL
jgi:hypothetical protein